MDTLLQSLAASFQTQLSQTGKIVVDATALSNPGLQGFLESEIGRSTIILVAQSIPTVGANDTQFAVSGTLPTVAADSFLGLLGQTVSITFVQHSQVIDFAADIVLGSGWTFPVSYPDLAYTPIIQTTLLDQAFRLVTWEDNGNSEGLYYSGTLQYSGPYTPLALLYPLSGSSLVAPTVQGRITVDDGIVTLAAIGSMQISALDLSIMRISSPQVGLWLDKNPSLYSPDLMAQVVANGMRATVSLGEDGLVGLETEVLLYFQNAGPYLQLLIAPTPGTVCSLDDLGNLMLGQTWNDLFTGYSGHLLQECFQSVGFLRYFADIDLSPLGVSATTVVLGSTAPYTFIEDVLVLNQLAGSWTLIPQGSGSYGSMISLYGELLLGQDVVFDIQVSLNDELSSLTMNGVLKGEVPLDVYAWMDALVSSLGLPSIPNYVASLLSGFTLTEIGMNGHFSTSASGFEVKVDGKFLLTGKEVQFSLVMDFEYSVTLGWSMDLGCTLELGGAILVGEVFARSGDVTISARWSDVNAPLSLEAIAESLGFDIPDIPPSLDLSLTEVSLTYNTNPTELILTATSANWGQALLTAFVQNDTWVFAFALDIGKSINLSNLPLIDKVLSGAETLAITEIQVMVNSQPITAQMAGDINSRLPEGALRLPSNGVNSVIGFAIVFDFAGLILPLSLGFGGTGTGDGPEKSTASGATIGTQSGNLSNPVKPSTPATSDGTIWINVQKTFGPVNIQKVGVRFENDVLWFLLTAEMTIAGLSISLNGLSVGTPLDTFEPHFNLDGMGLDFKTPGFELGGALLNMRLTPPDFEYAGIADIEVFGVGLGLVGAYGQVDGNATMFVFGQLTGLALGQPYLMVTGFSGGLGYNSSLRLPGIDEVSKFPFVAGLTDSSAVGGKNATPMDVLNVLMGKTGGTAWVSPDPGQYWIAAGLELNSFGIIDINALAVLEFGNDLEISLIGLATAKFPPEGITLGQVQLQLMALYRDADGVLSISAVLSNNSYLLDPQLKLTGGFAFNTWFRGPHVGDFVATLGGYHPQFNVPNWYPKVPRLGLSWSLGSLISMTGGTYLAMTPAAMMVGGSLNLNYMSGSLKAWLTAKFDAILRFLPIAFDVNIGVTVGASYTQDLLFSTKTITAEIGANLHMYGPPTGGSAQVDWWVFSFSIDFGAAKQSPAPVTWTDFASLLPPPGQYASISAAGGLSGQLPQDQGDEAAQGESDNSTNQPAWLVKKDGLRIKVTSAIPIAAIYLDQNASSSSHVGSELNILPLQQTGLSSIQRIVLQRRETVPVTISLANGRWTLNSVLMSVPKSLWGTGTGYTVPNGSDQLVPDQLVGVELVAPEATAGSATGAFDTSLLAEVSLSQGAVDPLQHGQASQGAAPVADSHALSTLLDDLNTQAAITARQNLTSALDLLGIDLGPTDADLDTFTEAAGTLFQDEPLLIENVN